MTVRAIVPLIRYTGNGTTTRYDWDWDMIDDSTINVMVDNSPTTAWSLEGQSVIFHTAPADGAEIVIYRRTKIWMPEDYRAFGRFHSEKTELSMDRQTLIAQERQGDSIDPANPNGIVGGSDLYVTRQEYTLTVVSERGTDAVIPMYIPDDDDPVEPGEPDDTVIWAGDTIYASWLSTEGDTTRIQFMMDFTLGDPTEASAFYYYLNELQTVGWCSEDPDDDEYWMRVTLTSDLAENLYTIHDGTYPKASGEAFKIRGVALTAVDAIVDRDGNPLLDRDGNTITGRFAYPTSPSYGPWVSVNTYGLSSPVTTTGTFTIEICKDDGSGLPDGEWVSRTVVLEQVNSTSGQSVWSADPSWALSDSDQYTSPDADITVSGSTGVVTGVSGNSLSGPWHADGMSDPKVVTDPENYEARLVVTNGDALDISGDSVDTWYNLGSTDPSWKVQRRTSESGQSIWDLDLQIRRVNENATSKRITVTLEKVAFDPAGSVSFESIFGAPFGPTVNEAYHQTVIPAEGLAIRFTVPSVSNVGGIFNALEIYAGDSITMAVNQTVGDVTTPPTEQVGGPSSKSISYGIDRAGYYDIDLQPGQTYYLNIKSNDGAWVWWNLRFIWQQF